jgi:hypothetical protein
MSDPVKFKDFNFKLAVIQRLMYDQNILTPRFDVYAFAANYTERHIDVEEEGYAIIPEVRQYFAELNLPVEALRRIERLYQDGGDEIYGQLYPFWDGEDDVFDIRSADDAALLPNLRAVTLFYTGDDQLLAAFRRKGITATWL